eukprot:69942_1
MVCAKCQKKLTKNITPNTHYFHGKWIRDKKPKIEVKKKDINKMLDHRLNYKKKKKKFKKGANGKCRICKGVCHQKLYYYCQQCAYQKGICAMCGKKLHDVSKYCQTNV